MKEILPDLCHSLSYLRRLQALRNLLGKMDLIIRDKLCGYARGLTADVPFSVREHIKQELQDNIFLLLPEIDGIFFHDSKIGPEVSPVFFTSDAFQQINKPRFMTGVVHDFQI